jgi:predicted O-methyltransferase YrrM
VITHRNQLGNLLTHLNFTNAAEIGVQKGLFSKTILSNWPIGHLTLIDSWENMNNDLYDDIANVSNEEHLNNLNYAKENLKTYFKQYTIIKGYSSTVVHEFKDDSFDLVYLDANHEYNHVYEDISLWINKVKNGGLLCGHDYLDGNLYEGNFGVKSAVKDFFKRDPDFVTLEQWPSWFIKIKK